MNRTCLSQVFTGVLLMVLTVAACNSGPEPQTEPVPSMEARYFPEPDQNLERVSSDAQDFYVQTVLEGLNV
ncbi:MAG: hypothetical protein ACQETM_09920, partial [Bacteroidota bacterium]